METRVVLFAQVLPQQYGGKSTLLPITEAVRRFQLPPYPHLPELRAARAAAAGGPGTSAASVASDAPSADDSSGPNAADESESEEFFDAEEDFEAVNEQGSATSPADALHGQTHSKLQQKQYLAGLVAVNASP